MTARVRLNLGCGHKQFEGWVNVDIRQLPGVDVVWDLDQYPWPWQDGEAYEIRALHIIEHLKSGLIAFCDECWRLLMPGGTLYAEEAPGTLHVEVPDAADPDLSWCDPEHERPYRKHSFINYLTLGGIARFGYTDRAWSILHIVSDDQIVRVHMTPVPPEHAHVS